MPLHSFPNSSDPDSAPLLPQAERICEWVQRVAIVVGLGIGASNLAVWLSGYPWSAFAVMRVNTAVAVTAAAISLACWRRATPGSLRAGVAQTLGAVAALIGGLTAAQDIFGVDFGIDQLLRAGTYPGDAGNAFVVHPGRMSANAAISLLFLGLSLIALNGSARIGKGRIYVGPGLAILAALPAALGLVGYLLHVGRFTGLLRSTNILFHTAVALFALAVGVLAARPMRRPVRRILSTGADGVLLRCTLPATVAVLLALGWAIGRARQAGIVAPGEGTALMLYGGLVLLSGVLIFAGRALTGQETRARSANAALRVGEARSRAILDTALDGVLLIDVEGRIVDWNPAAEQIFGWRREEMIGQLLVDRVVPHDFRAAHRRALARLRQAGKGRAAGRRIELSAIRRDGVLFPAEVSISPLPGSEPTLFVGFVRDITQQKAVQENLRSAKEAAEAASRAKDSFLAALSHELRTPLAPVLMSAGALREDLRLPDDVRTEMAMIERNIALEARLIDDLLDLTRIARGKLPLRVEYCDVNSLLSYAVAIVRNEAQTKGVTLEVELAAARSGLAGDSARLQQVFWNLLKNAVKFTPAGGHITVQSRDGGSESDRVTVEVRDSGIGFTSETAEHIFQPFEQGGREGDHRFGGLGLGLAIARAIVDLHGGTIRAQSDGPGLGATFSVELPGGPAPEEVNESSPPAPHLSEDAQPLRLLVVEDHEPTLAILTRLLVRSGHHVISAANVTDALAASGGGVDAVISDLGLPDGTGLELMARLRERLPHIRGIALTGYGTEDDIAQSREVGFAAHLVKPVDFEQLRRALRALDRP